MCGPRQTFCEGFSSRKLLLLFYQVCSRDLFVGVLWVSVGFSTMGFNSDGPAAYCFHKVFGYSCVKSLGLFVFCFHSSA